MTICSLETLVWNLPGRDGGKDVTYGGDITDEWLLPGNRHPDWWGTVF